MKTIWKWTAGLGMVCFGANALGVVNDAPVNRYQTIPERNVFALKPIVQPTATNETVALVLPKLFLTGFTTILSNKVAILNVQFLSKPGQPQTEKSLMLKEGQRDGEIEVLTINEISGTVQVNNSGTIMSLTFEKDGVKPSAGNVAAGAAVPAPAAPGSAPPGTYLAATNGNPFSPNTPGYAASRVPGRNLKLPNMTSPPAPPTMTVPPPPSPAALGAPAAAARAQAGIIAKPLTPEEEQLLKELEAKTGTQAAPQ
jgi:hypothetical protein